MRINQFIAKSTGISRRTADDAIAQGRVLVNGQPAQLGQAVDPVNDTISLDKSILGLPESPQTILLHKPVGYVCSRDGQGSKTIYDLLPQELHNLKPVGRLDKDSSGLLLLTNDGKLAHELTHPSFHKEKVYEVTLDNDLSESDFETITKSGVPLVDGPSKFFLDFINDENREWKVTMTEGRNRQIRRTFEALGYKVIKLHRTQFGDYQIGRIPAGEYSSVTKAH